MFRIVCQGEYLDLKREEVMRGRRRLNNEKLCNLYTSGNIIRVAKSNRMI
jgi:hypothetical protein